MAQTLTILGASVRAALQSANRAGLASFGGDLFCDVDTLTLGNCQKVDHYPRGFIDIARQGPDGPWLYTGGFENYPSLVDEISSSKILWGNPGHVLTKIRSPQIWTQALVNAGLPALRVESDRAGMSGSVDWVQKPLKSSGGHGISFVNSLNESLNANSHYFQEFAKGESISALLLSNQANAHLIGFTKQLIGQTWAGASGFTYTGSLGPCFVSKRVEAVVRKVANCLTERFRLRGLWGIDGIVANDSFYAVEINPRYTASVEILEWACGHPLLPLHRSACIESQLPEKNSLRLMQRRNPQRSVRGKAIGFATSQVTVTPKLLKKIAILNRKGDWPAVADIPHLGEVIEPGRPVLTVFAEGWPYSNVVGLLRRRLNELIYSD